MKEQVKPRRKKNEIKITVEYVDIKDVSPEVRARIKDARRCFGKYIFDIVQKTRDEKNRSEIDSEQKP